RRNTCRTLSRFKRDYMTPPPSPPCASAWASALANDRTHSRSSRRFACWKSSDRGLNHSAHSSTSPGQKVSWYLVVRVAPHLLHEGDCPCRLPSTAGPCSEASLRVDLARGPSWQSHWKFRPVQFPGSSRWIPTTALRCSSRRKLSGLAWSVPSSATRAT